MGSFARTAISGDESSQPGFSSNLPVGRADESAVLVQGQNRVLRLILSGAPLPEILGALVRMIEAQSPEMVASILLLDADGLHLRHGTAPSLPESYRRAIDGEPIGPAAGSCGTAAFRRAPVLVEDIATDPLWEKYRDLALAYELRACWSTPIFQNNECAEVPVLGTFALYFHSPCLPTRQHRELIEMATQTAAIAIVQTRKTEALMKSEERLRLATTGGNLGIWDWDVETGRLTWSDGLQKIFNWPHSAEDLTLEKIFEVIHPNDCGIVEAALRRAIATGEDYEAEFRIRLNDGSLHWIASHGRVQCGVGGSPLRMLGVARDITPRRQAEEEMKRREAQLIEAQRIAHMGSYEWDVSTNKVDRSAELCSIFGVSPNEFAPTFEGYLQRVHPEDRSRTREVVEQAFRRCQPFDHEERIVRPDGSVRTLRSQGRFLCDRDGLPQKLIGICQDITEHKEADQQLQAANAALAQELEEKARTEEEIRALSDRLLTAQEEERTRIARELHDDICQQIAALSIGASNLKAGIPAEFPVARGQSERIREKLADLGQSVRRLSHELHPALLEHCSLDVALQSLCSEFMNGLKISVAFHASGSFESVPPAIAICAYRITQEALQNVAKHANTHQAIVKLSQHSGAMGLTIADHGSGMDLKRVRGGLGLTSIRERTRLVNGTIEIKTELGSGTTLNVTLPIPPSGS